MSNPTEIHVILTTPGGVVCLPFSDKSQPHGYKLVSMRNCLGILEAEDSIQAEMRGECEVIHWESKDLKEAAVHQLASQSGISDEERQSLLNYLEQTRFYS